MWNDARDERRCTCKGPEFSECDRGLERHLVVWIANSSAPVANDSPVDPVLLVICSSVISQSLGYGPTQPSQVVSLKHNGLLVKSTFDGLDSARLLARESLEDSTQLPADSVGSWQFMYRKAWITRASQGLLILLSPNILGLLFVRS